MTTILIVDDEDGFRHLFQIILSRAGYAVLSARSGAEAVALVETHAIDLIILDDMLPDAIGSEVCIAIKEIMPHVPVIMHSAGTRARTPEYLQQAGADGFLPKPSTPGEILTFVTNLVRVRI
jgi:DNA-binding response OmpR family regulator